MIEDDYINIAINFRTITTGLSFVFMLLGMSYLTGFVFTYKSEDHPTSNITPIKLKIMRTAIAIFWFFILANVMKVSVSIFKDIKENGNPFLEDMRTPPMTVPKKIPYGRADVRDMI